MHRFVLSAICCLLVALTAHAQEGSGEAASEPGLQWQPGPRQVILGNDVAQVELEEAEVFLDGQESRKLLELTGNIPSGNEVGIISSREEDQNWFLVFKYNDIGYVKDDEKGKIDAAALLESIKEGNEEANKIRRKRGMNAMHILGWSDPPHYDSQTHNLVWGIRARNDDGEEVINYNVRVLGREGVMSVTLVDDPSGIMASKPSLAGILSRFEYRPGRRYSEWRQGDRVAEYGLTALVAAGAGAAAVKMGLFAKLGKLFAKFAKLIIVALVALGAAFMKLMRALFGRPEAQPGVEPPPGS